MRKILLIEDVISRQNSFMKERSFTLEAYADILDNAIGEKYQDIASALKKNDFDFDAYAMIIAHKSAFESDVGVMIERLKAYCKERDTPLVFFSGGTQNYYNNTHNEYLELETKYFYSNNLKLFLESYKEGKENILMLTYGEKWVANTVLNILEKINLYLNENSGEKILYDKFKSKTEVDKLKNIDYSFYYIDKKWAKRDEIIKLRDDILRYIQTKASY